MRTSPRSWSTFRPGSSSSASYVPGSRAPDESFHQAPLPARPIERGRPGPGLLAHVLVSKYYDSLPLYRQSRIYAREGVELERSTLAGWARRRYCSYRWPIRSVGTCSPVGQFSPMTHRSRCWPRERARTRPGAPRRACVTSVPGQDKERRRPGTGSPPTARPIIP